MNTLPFRAPYYDLVVNGINITGVLKNCLISITVKEYSGVQADTVELVLSDTALVDLLVPRATAMVVLTLGYEFYTVYKGIYYVASREVSGPPNTMTLTATAIDPRNVLYSSINQVWPPGTTVQAIVTALAGLGAFIPNVPPLFSYPSPMRHINNESPLQFLSRLAFETNALFTIKNNTLIWLPNAVLPTTIPVTINAHGVLNWKLIHGDRYDYNFVDAYWLDPIMGQYLLARAINPITLAPGSIYTLPKTYFSNNAALAACQSQMMQFRKRLKPLEITVIGDPTLSVQRFMAIRHVRTEINIETTGMPWTIDEVTHRLTPEGYTCDVKAYL